VFAPQPLSVPPGWIPKLPSIPEKICVQEPAIWTGELPHGVDREGGVCLIVARCIQARRDLRPRARDLHRRALIRVGIIAEFSVFAISPSEERTPWLQPECVINTPRRDLSPGTSNLNRRRKVTGRGALEQFSVKIGSAAPKLSQAIDREDRASSVGIVISHADIRPIGCSGDLHGRGVRRAIAFPELARKVRTAGPEGAIGLDPGPKLPTGCDCIPSSRNLDGRRNIDRCRTVLRELSVSIITPCPERAAVLDGQNERIDRTSSFLSCPVPIPPAETWVQLPEI
jgi:hypothetical protein